MGRVGVTCALLVATCCLSTSLAATGPMDVYAQEAANRVGLLEHCQALGFARAGDVENARKILMNRPAMPPDAILRAAEGDGKKGKLLAAGQYMSLEQLADRSHMTVGQICDGFVENASVAAGMIDHP